MDARRSLVWRSRAVLAAGMVLLGAACAIQATDNARMRLWEAGFGPVLPHDTFPADCSLCHEGGGWQDLRDDFTFDHELETGVPLHGAHENASCIRCHNDRGPVQVFAQRGCEGCHEDVHRAQLGSDCTLCHIESAWEPVGQIERHNHTRFPLEGVHATTACHRCHPGAEVGKFLPTDTECLTCHTRDLANATNPNHIGLGWVDRCDRCHLPRTWQQAEINN